ncbi:energy transducer TonB [Pseudochryseolinea flava]|nr:energy transducer TonB [Pseudochryseolinea flava]
MIKYTFLVILVLTMLSTYAQVEDKKDIVVEKKETATADEENTVFTSVEIAAEYPGGTVAMDRFIKKTMEYPAVAKLQGQEGKVFVGFVVSKKDGSLSDAKIIKGLTPECDQEALRIVSLMPKWKPGMKNGKQVDTRYVLPIKFEIPEEEKRPAVGTENVRGVDEISFDEPAPVVEETYDENHIYTVVDTPPQPVEGMAKLNQTIKDNLKYPKKALKDRVEGTVFVIFVVNKDGSLVDFQVVKKSASELLDKEAIRVLSTLPKWTPGSNQGKVVRTKFVLPVKFKLPEEKK